ncbi:MAG: hypothetical protein ACJ763_01820 [Bdellovibrionia bacterium]
MSSNQQNQNDIDQILSEVEELRKELSSEAEAVDTQAVAKEMAQVLSSVDTPAAPSAAPTLAQATEVAKELAALAEDVSASVSPNISSGISEEASADDLMKEFHASLEAGEVSDLGESMESTLAELKDDPTVKTLLDQTFDDQARRQSEAAEVPASAPIFVKETPVMSNTSQTPQAPQTNDESSPSLTMSLTGSMTLKLKYEFAGQEVTVGFSDDFLKIELADGTEFKIPVGRQKTLRRVA